MSCRVCCQTDSIMCSIKMQEHYDITSLMCQNFTVCAISTFCDLCTSMLNVNCQAHAIFPPTVTRHMAVSRSVSIAHTEQVTADNVEQVG